MRGDRMLYTKDDSLPEIDLVSFDESEDAAVVFITCFLQLGQAVVFISPEDESAEAFEHRRRKVHSEMAKR